MKTSSVFDEIINNVETYELSKLLSLSLFLAKQLKDDNMMHWIKLELNCYYDSNAGLGETDIVPEYRTIVGNYFDVYDSILKTTKSNLRFISEYRIREGIISIENILTHNKGLVTIQALEFIEIIKENLNVEVDKYTFSVEQL